MTDVARKAAFGFLVVLAFLWLKDIEQVLR